jgi:hypothetical protein
MLKLISTMTIFFTLPALGATAFDDLVTQFNSAQPVKFADIDGWYSGRCFESAAKNVALPGLLAIADFTSGPRFPSQTYLLNLRGLESGRQADFFDRIDTPEEKAKLATYVFSGIANRARTSIEKSSGTVTEILMSNANKAGTYMEFRRANQTVIMVERANADIVFDYGRRNSNASETFKKGQIVEVCYYFLKIMTLQEAGTLR